jgi:hypothetical protein
MPAELWMVDPSAAGSVDSWTAPAPGPASSTVIVTFIVVASGRC